jgi:GNAT superfamily N-acetyltransferase
MSAVTVRPAEPEDVATMYGFIRELAAYERAPDAVTGTADMLREALFGSRRSAEALLAVDARGEPVGFALFHGTFSTWECRPGIWLEDLFVPERRRRGGVGGELLRALAALAVERGCARLEWTALDWNASALTFYAGLGAERLQEWTTHRLDGDALAAVAGSFARERRHGDRGPGTGDRGPGTRDRGPGNREPDAPRNGLTRRRAPHGGGALP